MNIAYGEFVCAHTVPLNNHTHTIHALLWLGTDQVPVPLMIFRSNSKLDQNFKCFGFKCTLPITTKFCTCQDSVTVVMCAKFRCDRFSIS